MNETVVGVDTRLMKAALEDKLFERPPEPVRIGRFVVVDRLGAGAMGTVYRAYDPDLDRRVAVKVLRSCPGSAHSESEATARLLREAKTMARLNHPNVVTVHEVGMFEEQVFIAMEYVDAGTLADWMCAHEVGSAARIKGAVEFAIQVARGLAAAHAAGVVHRDLKPANILVDHSGRLRIADFGLASSRGGASLATHDPTDAQDAVTLSKTGNIIGTPAYMAPEQLQGHADARSDLFSYCASFFEAVYGVAPFAGQTIAARALNIAQGHVVDVPGSAGPAWLHAFVMRGLAEDPNDRPSSIAAMLAELEQHSRPRTRTGLLAGVLGAALVGGVLLYGSDRGDGCADGATGLGDAWSSDRRAAVGAGLRSSDLPYAEPTAQRVSAILDEYSSEWSAAYEDACSATWERGEQSAELLDLRMACLDRGRAALGFLSSTLVPGGADTVRSAAALAQGLPDLQPCSDTELLRRRRDRGRSQQQVAAAATARQLMDQARISVELARLEEADTTLAKARTAVEGLDLPEVLSAIDTELSQLRVQQERSDQAKSLNKDALHAALAGVDGDAVAWAYAARARMALRDDDTKTCAWSLDMASAAVKRGDSPRTRDAQIAAIRGELATKMGDVDEAITQLDRAAEIFSETLGPDAVVLSRILYTKAAALGASGRQDEALALALEAAAFVARLYGDTHPGQAVALALAAHVLFLRDEIDEALALHLRAYELLAADPGFQPRQRARVMLFVADDYGRLANFDEALQWLQRAETLFVEILGPDHPDTVLAEFSRGSLKLDLMQDFVGAAEAFTSVIARWEGVEARVHNTAIARLNLAIAQSRAGQHQRASASATAARAAFEEFVAPDGQQMIGYLSSFGDIYRAADQASAAVSAYERAIEISDAHGGNGFLIDEARFGLAQLLLEQGDRVRATELAERARANFVADGERKAQVLGELDAWRREQFPEL